jgi:DNA polymerase I-like protein with 3'-5' exonuclease and polymerase domains
VCFTGKNLAERMFHSDAPEYQVRVLDIQDMYFKNFPMLRRWQKKVTDEIEDSHMVRSLTGRFVRLYDRDEDDIKFSMSMKGSGTSADYVQEIMLNYWREGIVPLIQVHDELDFEVPENASDRQINELRQLV